MDLANSGIGMNRNNIFSFKSRIPPPGKKTFWFAVLLAIKFCFLFFIIHQHRPTLLPGSIAICAGDCSSYIDPVNSLITKGSYDPDFRMPGYGFPYLLFRLFFDVNLSASLLIIFQTFIDALACLLLAGMLFRITGKTLSFYLALLFYGASTTVSGYNNWILTESLTSSTLIFGVYFFYRFIKDEKKFFLVLSGAFFTWSYFMRPVTIGILFIIALLLLLFLRESRIKLVMIFLLPAFIINSAWTIRNYITKKKIFVLTETRFTTAFYPNSINACIKFCSMFSDFKIATCFFQRNGLHYFGQPVPPPQQDQIVFPDEIYTPDFSRDSLLILRSYFDELSSIAVPAQRRAYLDSLLTSKFTTYTESIRRYHPFLVYVKTPLLLTRRFAFQLGTHNLYFYPFSYLSLSQKIIKFFFISIYWTAFTFFLTGFFSFSKSVIHNKIILTSYLIAFYIIFIHSIVLRSVEFRYLIPAYPFFVAGAVYFVCKIRRVLAKKDANNDPGFSNPAHLQ